MPIPIYIRQVRRNVSEIIRTRSAAVLADLAAQENVVLPAIKTLVNSRRRVKPEEYYKLFPAAVVAAVAVRKSKSEDDTHFSDVNYGIAVQVTIIGSDAEALTEQIELYIAGLDYLLTDVVEEYELLAGVPQRGSYNVEVTEHDFAEIEFEGENEYRHTASLTLVVWKDEEGSGRRGR